MTLIKTHRFTYFFFFFPSGNCRYVFERKYCRKAPSSSSFLSERPSLMFTRISIDNSSFFFSLKNALRPSYLCNFTSYPFFFFQNSPKPVFFYFKNVVILTSFYQNAENKNFILPSSFYCFNNACNISILGKTNIKRGNQNFISTKDGCEKKMAGQALHIN